MSVGKIILFLVVFNVLGLCRGQGGGGGAPGAEYVLNFDSPIYVCPDELSMTSMNTSGLEVVNINETSYTINGIIGILKELPPRAFRVEVIAKKEVSGKLEVVVNKEICDLCLELHPGSEHWKYLKFFGFPPECPFPPGQYNVAGFVPHKDDLPVNSSNAARYQVTIFIYYNPEGDCDHYEDQIYMFCLMLDFVVEALE